MSAARILAGGIGRGAGRIAPPTFKASSAAAARAPIRAASAAESVVAVAAGVRTLTQGSVGCVATGLREKSAGKEGDQKKGAATD
jgi:hypothetical protein